MGGAELARHRDRRRTRYAAVAVAALAVSSCLALALGPTSSAQTPARLEILSPAADLQRQADSSFEPVSGSTEVPAGSVIRTSDTGVAQISYGDGSLTRIGPDTTYALTTLQIAGGGRQIVGRLDIGQTFHRVTKVSGSDSRFEVQTSKAIAAVRGTAFSVRCLTRVTCEVAVSEGIVAVITPDGVSVDVTAGRSVVVGGDGRAGPLQTAPPAQPWFPSDTEPTGDPGGSPDSPNPEGAPEPSSSTTASSTGSTSSGTSGPSSTTRPESSGEAASSVSSTTLPGGYPSGTTMLTTPSTTTTTTPITTTTIPPTSVCPGLSGDPEPPAVGALDGQAIDCLPCELGDTSPRNPNCSVPEEGNQRRD